MTIVTMNGQGNVDSALVRRVMYTGEGEASFGLANLNPEGHFCDIKVFIRGLAGLDIKDRKRGFNGIREWRKYKRLEKIQEGIYLWTK